MTVLVTGAGLVGTSFAQNAIARGEEVVFVDPEPRTDYLTHRLGAKGWRLERGDVRDLAGLLAIARKAPPAAVVHTAGLIGRRVEESLGMAFEINLHGTLNVAETVRLAGVARLVHVSTFGVYDWRRPMTAPAESSSGGCAARLKRIGQTRWNPSSCRTGRIRLRTTQLRRV